MEELRELLELIGAEKACGAGLIWGLGSTEDGSNIDEAPVCSSADRALFNCVCVCVNLKITEDWHLARGILT